MLMMAIKSIIDPTTIPGLIPSTQNGEDTYLGDQDDTIS